MGTLRPAYENQMSETKSGNVSSLIAFFSGHLWISVKGAGPCWEMFACTFCNDVTNDSGDWGWTGSSWYMRCVDPKNVSLFRPHVVVAVGWGKQQKCDVDKIRLFPKSPYQIRSSLHPSPEGKIVAWHSLCKIQQCAAEWCASPITDP